MPLVVLLYNTKSSSVTVTQKICLFEINRLWLVHCRDYLRNFEATSPSCSPYQKPLRCQENMNAPEVEGFGQTQQIYCEQLTIADTQKNQPGWNQDWFTLKEWFTYLVKIL